MGALLAVGLRRRAMCGALAVCVAMAAWVLAINPVLMAMTLPPHRLPSVRAYLSQALPALAGYGLAMLVATAAGGALGHRRAAQRGSPAATQS